MVPRRMLLRKTGRDIRRGRLQVVAVVVVAFLGIAIFDASYLAYQNLRQSYSETRSRTHLADMTLVLSRPGKEDVSRVAALPDVADAEERIVTDLPADVGGRRVEARLISIPVGEQPSVNQLVLVKGHYPQKSDEVLVETHFAAAHELGPGDTVQLAASSHAIFTVSGVAISPEYLWVTKSRQEIMPSPDEFGVFFVPRESVAAETGSVPDGGAQGEGPARGLTVAPSPGAGIQLVYTLRPGADADAVLNEVTRIVGAERILSATSQEDLPGVRVLQMDLDGFREMAIAFPTLFLAVGAFIVAALMNRQVDQERTVIGTMLALGTSKRAVLWHYTAFSLVIGLVAVALGSAAGAVGAAVVTTEYAKELNIPFVTFHLSWTVVLIGAMIGLGVVVAGGWLPARRAASLRPVEAMRVFTPEKSPRFNGVWMRWLPLWLRTAIRGVSRHPGRSAGTAMGVVAALVLVISTAGMIDSTVRGIDLTFNRSIRYDLRVQLLSPQPAGLLMQTAKGVAGVKQVDALLTVPVKVETPDGSASYNTVLSGRAEDDSLLQVVDSKGRAIQTEAGRVILPRSVAAKLDVGRGDEVKLTLLPSGPETTAMVSDLSYSVMGNSVVMPASDVAAAFDLAGLATEVLVTTEAARHDDVRRRVEKMPGVRRVQDMAALRRQTDALMGFTYLFLGVMLLFGAVLAASILFNTATLTILERRRELATMRAIGRRMSEISRDVSVENGILAVAGILVGIPVAMWSLAALLGMFESDLFSLPYWVAPRTYAVAVVGVLVTVFLAQWPSLRTVARLNLADEIKARE